MTESKDNLSSQDLSEVIVKGIQEKKGYDINVLNLEKVGSAVADFFIICSGNSDTQVDAITDSVEKEVYKETGELPWHKEGYQNKQWILLDYANIVVHIFKKDVREFYGLEELWGDAQLTVIENEA